MNKNIILDIDDTLLGWSEGFVNWCRVTGEIPSSHVFDRRECVETLPFLTGNGQWHMDRVLAFNTSQAFAQLPIIPGARELVRDLQASGASLFVISAAGTGCAITEELRTSQLHQVFGNVFDTIMVIPLGASKKEFVDDISASSLLLDDSLRHANDQTTAGRDAIWIDFRGLGKTFNGLATIQHLSELYGIFKLLNPQSRVEPQSPHYSSRLNLVDIKNNSIAVDNECDQHRESLPMIIF